MRCVLIFTASAPSIAIAQIVYPARGILATASKSKDGIQPPTISIGSKVMLDRQPLNAADPPHSRGEAIARIRVD